MLAFLEVGVINGDMRMIQAKNERVLNNYDVSWKMVRSDKMWKGIVVVVQNEWDGRL